MKKILFIAVLSALLFSSCSGDENANPATAGSMTYKRIEVYTPSKALYDNPLNDVYATLEVKHFENGLITGDTLFNKTGTILSTTVYASTATTQTITAINAANGNAATVYGYTYDSQARVTAYERHGTDYHYKTTFTYNNDATISSADLDMATGESLDTGLYTLNSSGLISGYDINTHHQTIEYVNGVPVSYTYLSADSDPSVMNITYYDTAVPANHLKTNVQVNNVLLVSGLEYIADNTANYHKSTVGYEELNSTFNTLGYCTHTLFTGLVNNTTVETVYYYNEN